MTGMLRAIALSILFSLVGSATYAADVETGVKQYQDKKYAMAEDTLRAVVAEHAEDAQANHYLGLALMEQKKYAEAEEFLLKASTPRPDARVALAKVYMLQDKLDDALHVIQEAEEGHKDPDLYLTKGMVLLKQEKAAEAAGAFNKALELDGKNAYAHYYMGMAQNKLKRPDLMINHYELFLQLAPKAPEAARVRALLRSL